MASGPSLMQKHRKAAIGTPLGDDVLVLKSFSGTEELGRLFQFDVVLLSEKEDVKFDDIIGQNVTARLELADKKTRYFNGYVSRFVQVAPFNRYACYHATVVPWLWFLTRTADCRIFQNKTVPDIIEEVFKGHGFDGYQRSLSGSYEAWEYCVQYRETDFNFVSRLMEQEGIYYFFKHDDGKHTLVLADSKSAHQPFPGYEAITYRPPDRATSDFEHIRDWTIEKQLLTGAYSHTDFDFKKPKTSLRSNAFVARRHAAASFEVFDYPGEYVNPAAGETLAKVRIQELQSRYEVMHGETDARGLCAGYHFKLKDFGRADQNREYLVLSIHHMIEPDVFASAGGGGHATPLYHGSFSVIGADTPFRAARLTPKPLVQGPQTAMVVGPKGEEIYTDKYGRVKVMFHWDRYAEADENSSCWIRVSQSWAGKNWGAMYLPRIGQEVIVEFLEGDPDRPIITGRVYNDAAMPPYELPAEKTKSTLKSNSSKGGQGFNEIRFEDKKDKEQVFVHAQKDMDTRVRNDARVRVLHDHHEVIGCEQDGSKTGDRKAMVYHDSHLKVHRNKVEQIGGDLQILVGDIDGEGNLDIIARGEKKELIEKDEHHHVKGERREKVDGDQSLTVGGNQQEKVAMKHAVDAGQEIHLKSGMKLVLEAGVQLTLKGAGGFVDIGPAGVTIQGTLVNINSGGAAGAGSGASPAAPEDPLRAKPEEPALAVDAESGSVGEAAAAATPPKPVVYGTSAQVMKMAALTGAPFCEKCEAARRELERLQGGG